MVRLTSAAILFCASALAGFSVIDGDMPGEYFGNAQHSEFHHAMSGDTELTLDDRDFLASASRASLASRFYVRFRAMPMGRISVKKWIDVSQGIVTQLQGLDIKDDNFSGSLAAGYNFTRKFAAEFEYYQYERLAFDRQVMLSNLSTRFTGRLKAHAFNANFSYDLDALKVMMAGAPIIPFVELGVGYVRHDSSKLNNTNLAITTIAGSDNATIGGQGSFGMKIRASSDLSLDAGYRVNYLGRSRVARTMTTARTADIEAERIFVHGLYLGAQYHF